LPIANADLIFNWQLETVDWQFGKSTAKQDRK